MTYIYLVAELRGTVEQLIATHDLGGRAAALLTKAEGICKGINAVLVDGLEASGPELQGQDQLVRAGAMVANDKRNVLLLAGTFDRAEARGDFCCILGYTREGAKRDQPSEYYQGFQRGQETGEKIANAVDEMMEQLVRPWAADIIDIFTKRVAMKVIFCDEDPEREARLSLAEFNRAADDDLEKIRPHVRAKLSAYEQLSREAGALDAFEFLLKRRFDFPSTQFDGEGNRSRGVRG